MKRWLEAVPAPVPGMEWSPADRSPAAHYHFLTSAVAPRPIAWVTTVGADGTVNCAPFSYFQAVCSDPPMVMLSLSDRPGGGPKDTLGNIQATGEFVVHVAPAGEAERVVQTAAPYPTGTSEVEAAGLETVPSSVVRPPRLAASPVAMECRLVETRRFGERLPVTVVFGEVVRFHALDAVLDDRGNVRPGAVAFLARLGGHHYVAVRDTFEVAPHRLE